MAIKLRETLGKLFGTGMYPKSSDFRDAWDSFWHKSEDIIPLDRVEDLPALLQDKYPRADGEFASQKADNALMRIDEVEDEVNSVLSGINGDLGRMDEDILAVRTIINEDFTDDPEKDPEQDPDEYKSALKLAKEALSALGANYKDLQSVASTLRNFLLNRDSTSTSINTWKELEAFLTGITDSQNLNGILGQQESRITDAYTRAIANAGIGGDGGEFAGGLRWSVRTYDLRDHYSYDNYPSFILFGCEEYDDGSSYVPRSCMISTQDGDIVFILNIDISNYSSQLHDDDEVRDFLSQLYEYPDNYSQNVIVLSEITSSGGDYRTYVDNAVKGRTSVMSSTSGGASMNIMGGRMYYLINGSVSTVNIGYAMGFSFEKDCATLLVRGDTAVNFENSHFKLMAGISQIEGTSTQYKLYTFQMVPTDSGTANSIYLVNCALYL